MALTGLLCLVMSPDYAAARERPAPVPSAGPAVDLDQLEAALMHGRLIQARDMIRAAALARQKDPRLDLLTADYTLAHNDNELALEFYKPLLANPALKARAAEGAGLAALKLGRTGEASKFLRLSVETDASRARAWNGLGVIADDQRDWPSAHLAYSAAHAADPQNASIMNNMGYSLLLQHRYPEAIEVLKSALAAHPDDDRIRTNIKLALALNGQYAEAIGSDNDAGPLSRRLNNAGVAAHLRHDDVAAIAFLSRAIEISDVYNLIAANNLSLIRNSGKGNAPK